MWRKRALGALAVGAVTMLVACGGGGGGSSCGSNAPAMNIALVLPESKTPLYESKDPPLFEAKLKALCSICQIIYSNANQDAAQQQSQGEAALTNWANVLVLDA